MSISWLVGSEKRRFLLVGAYNTLFGYATFVVLYACLHQILHYLIIATLSHFMAVVNAFIAHRVFVFRAVGAWGTQFLRFNLTHLGTLGMGLAGMILLVEGLGLSPLAAQALLIVIVTITSYLAHKHFTFRR